MTLPKKIWALLDERAGNTSQTLGVAEALELSFEVKNIEFTQGIKLPNFLINRTALGIAKSSLQNLKAPWPDLVIGTARRLAVVATYIKAKNPKTFLAQIQWPTFPAHDFDLIAAPMHDEAKPGKNIIETIGAPHRVTDELLAKEAEKWRPLLQNLPAPKIALLVGGSAPGRKFAANRAEKLGKMVSAFANSIGGSLMITTSRRTDAEIVNILSIHLTCPYYLHDWHKESPDAPNPYYGFLGLADIIIATGDSVSMCSEASATGKPIYIYSAKDLATEKHQKFQQQLYSKGFAKPLEEATPKLFKPYGKLNDSLYIAAEIKKRMNL